MVVKYIFFFLAVLWFSSCNSNKTTEVLPVQNNNGNNNSNNNISPVLTNPGLNTSNHRILALGDSYTIGESVTVDQRYPNQLAAKLNTLGYNCLKPKIIATTGWSTRDLINAIQADGDTSKYDLVFLLIGVNNQYRNIPISVYAAEFPALLKTAIHFASDSTDHVFVLSIPDYAFTPFGQSKNPTQISKDLVNYNIMNQQITTSFTGVNYVDITPISRGALTNPNLVASDGLHPSAMQYGLWVDEILKKLIPVLNK